MLIGSRRKVHPEAGVVVFTSRGPFHTEYVTGCFPATPCSRWRVQERNVGQGDVG